MLSYSHDDQYFLSANFYQPDDFQLPNLIIIDCVSVDPIWELLLCPEAVLFPETQIGALKVVAMELEFSLWFLFSETP